VSAKTKILAEFDLFRGNGGGIEDWFSENLPERVADVLANCEAKPISCEELNQILILSHEAGVSRGFFRHYFCEGTSAISPCPYDPTKLPGFEERFLGSERILSLGHLKWGLYRLYVDSLLLYGNVRQGFRALRGQSADSIARTIARKAFNTEALTSRGEFLPLDTIAKDDRYLIAEIACKTYAPREAGGNELLQFLRKRLATATRHGGRSVTFRDLIKNSGDEQFPEMQLTFSLDEVLDTNVVDGADLERKLAAVTNKFQAARDKALRNTELYLSMVSDMDIYVATSMRSRTDFRNMANFCEGVFSDRKVHDLKLRYFDPTLSAAIGHEDKGLIECLMVKCAKVLVYNAGERESYGKDVEAAMALSQGKPVIFFCDTKIRANFYRDVHPLARLIDFETGVAGGAIVTDNPLDVPELISRIFRNQMEYIIDKKGSGYFMLKEKLTGSTVRLQTDDKMLRETFWNYYNHEAGLQD
jgi:hypothetical protein